MSIILASASARRRQLLNSANVQHDVIPSDVDEQRLAGETPATFATRMAQEKATAVATAQWNKGDSRPALGADTIVVIDGTVLGKPRNRDEAQSMLRKLSGHTHAVITGVCLACPAQTLNCCETTNVTFVDLSPTDIDTYLDRAHWQDKAGAYAVQEHAACMVRSIHGSYTNVVGLPLAETIDLLRAASVIF